MRQQLVVYRQPNGQQNELDPICVEKAETPVRAVLIEQHSSDLSCQVWVLQRDSVPGAHLTCEHRIAQEHCGAINAARRRRRYSAGQPKRLTQAQCKRTQQQ